MKKKKKQKLVTVTGEEFKQMKAAAAFLEKGGIPKPGQTGMAIMASPSRRME